MKKGFLISAIMLLFVSVTAFSGTLDIESAYGVVASYDTEEDTLSGDSIDAVILSDFTIRGLQKGCIYVLTLPRITGGGVDSMYCALNLRGYTSDDTLLFEETVGDSLGVGDTLYLKRILPIETPLAPADKYELRFSGTDTTGGQIIFKPGKIYALQNFYNKNR